jgi:hypothetical protein
MRIVYFLFLSLITATLSFSQEANTVTKSDFISIQSGLAINNYNAMSMALGFEYQKQIKGNWSLGYMYSTSRFVREAANEALTTELNQNHLSVNLYYRLSLIKEKIFWDFGAGAGATHAYFGEDIDDFGLEVNLSSTLNIKLFKRVYFQASPLLVLIPSNRVYFSDVSVNGRDNLFAFSMFPFGVKIAL